jgi:outer membrane receptor protein involved in Fe transport
VPRGSRGRTPELYNLNLGLKFTQPLGWRNGRLQVSLDVFNVFDADTEIALNEYTQKETGETSFNYLLPRNFQPPRSIRLSARVDF